MAVSAMPLFPDGRDLVRRNLEQFRPDKKIRVASVVIGELTVEQLNAINGARSLQGLAPIRAEVLFFGSHIYQSRVLRDGYLIEDVIDQIESAMKEESIVLDLDHMTAIENSIPRPDRYGNIVTDRAVFECTTRHPRPELFSVIPKGDHIKPAK
jgi:hypothetical protein